MTDITIVTAFFDIGRGNMPREMHGRIIPEYQHRSVETYFGYFDNLAKIKNNMIIYTTPDLEDTIYRIREKYDLKDKTKVVCFDSYLPEEFVYAKDKIKEIMDSYEYYSKVKNPHFIEYWHSDYVLVNIFKSYYVSHAVDNGLIDTELTAWIDFGYCRNDYTIPPSNRWSWNFNIDKIHFFNIRDLDVDRPISDIIYTGDVYVMGCHIVAGTDMWKYLSDAMIRNLNKLLDDNLIDDDQTLMLMCYLDDKEKFTLTNITPSNWFVIFHRFNLESK